MKKFFTWRDIEVEIYLNRQSWPANWLNVDVYKDEINITTKNNEFNYDYFKQLFGSYYNNDGHFIDLPFGQNKLEITYNIDEEYNKVSKHISPLFKNIYLEQVSESLESIQNLEGAPVIAFHSYKGGVGRTLSLIGVVREITEKYKGEKKVLIIDSDIEAPGLTWMANEQQNTNEISYLDILSIIHSSEINEELVGNIANLVEKSVLTFETESVSQTHFFIPTYRFENQLMDIYSTPEKILLGEKNKFLLTEFFSLLGSKLGVDMVLIDLRAGVSEYSAPYIFDPRVRKYFVTSTSLQSVKGIQLILKQVMKYCQLGNIPQILLTMIPQKFDNDSKNEIMDCLLEPIKDLGDGIDDTTWLIDDYITEIPFASELIHLGNLHQICKMLSITSMRQELSKIIQYLFTNSLSNEDSDESIDNVRIVLQKMNEIALSEITAEGNAYSKMLNTGAIQEIARYYKRDLPRMVILGAKGSGKTYLYKQLLLQKTWNNFINSVEKYDTKNEDPTLIIPVLSTKNRLKFKDLFGDCISFLNDNLADVEISNNAHSKNADKIQQIRYNINMEYQWKELWIRILLETLNNKFNSLEELDHYLATSKKRIIFMFDGIEDIFDEIEMTESSKNAIKALCQGIINDLAELEKGNIGTIIFLRKDLAENAITTNYAQFLNQYSKFELNWTQTEALRLALWLAIQADKDVFALDVDISIASREIIENKLTKLWGNKLGKSDSKEAMASRWIIAALSDFNGQLQARDVVRFLRYVTENYASVTLSYKDRYIMPTEIRKAISPCSNDKVIEIKAEIKSISSILDKFEKLPEENKFLPLDLDKIYLTKQEAGILMKQGYLKIYKEQYYLPEIIRQNFGFKYTAGARPKVLALLVQK